MRNEESILIPTPPQFSFEECLWFLNRNFDDCMLTIRDHCIYKALQLNGERVLIRVSEAEGAINVDILLGSIDKGVLISYISEWFDLERDIQPFYTLLAAEPSMAYMAEKYQGLRLVSITDMFEAICWSIIGQQINLTFAYKLKRRLVELFGSKMVYEGESHYIFPEAEVLAQIEPEELKSLQFSQRKAEYIIIVARAFAEGIVSKQKVMELPALPEKQKLLTDLKGVGIWTANYVLIKSLREPASIPHGDVGLLQALQNHQVIERRDETELIARFFEKYQGWESYLVFYLWRSLSVKDT
jgi:DNA-3-methyladenine glycosylase II